MSTIPGPDAERDAGLTSPDLDEPVTLTEEVEARRARPDGGLDDHDLDEHVPSPARPDLDGEASEADVLEQHAVQPVDDDDHA